MHYERFQFPTLNFGAVLQRNIPRNSAGQLDVDQLAKPNDINGLFDISEYDVFWSTLENGPKLHGDVHVWVRRSMILWTSPNDPIFWMHHANIDRIWAHWQVRRRADWEESNPGQEYDHGTHYVTPTGTGHGHGLNHPMWPWDDGASKPARFDPDLEIGIQGQNLDSAAKREINKFAFAGRALPLDFNLPQYGKRTPADLLDVTKSHFTYDDLMGGS